MDFVSNLWNLEQKGEKVMTEEGRPTTRERKWNILQMELLKRECLQKGIPKKGLTEIKLAVGGKGIKAAN